MIPPPRIDFTIDGIDRSKRTLRNIDVLDVTRQAIEVFVGSDQAVGSHKHRHILVSAPQERSVSEHPQMPTVLGVHSYKRSVTSCLVVNVGQRRGLEVTRRPPSKGPDHSAPMTKRDIDYSMPLRERPGANRCMDRRRNRGRRAHRRSLYRSPGAHQSFKGRPRAGPLLEDIPAAPVPHDDDDEAKLARPAGLVQNLIQYLTGATFRPPGTQQFRKCGRDIGNGDFTPDRDRTGIR
jgi:hypothetical protein